MEQNNELIVEKWLSENFHQKEATDKFWGLTAICQPLIQQNRYIKTNETTKTKVNGVTFRYMANSGMPQTKSYQVLYKILHH